jgi:hypothetical protein
MVIRSAARFLARHGQVGSNANGGGTSKDAFGTRPAQDSVAGHSLHFGLSAHHRSTTAQENLHFQKILNMMLWLRSNVMQVSLSNHVCPGPTNESKSQTV